MKKLDDQESSIKHLIAYVTDQLNSIYSKYTLNKSF